MAAFADRLDAFRPDAGAGLRDRARPLRVVPARHGARGSRAPRVAVRSSAEALSPEARARIERGVRRARPRRLRLAREQQPGRAVRARRASTCSRTAASLEIVDDAGRAVPAPASRAASSSPTSRTGRSALDPLRERRRRRVGRRSRALRVRLARTRGSSASTAARATSSRRRAASASTASGSRTSSTAATACAGSRCASARSTRVEVLTVGPATEADARAAARADARRAWGRGGGRVAARGRRSRPRRSGKHRFTRVRRAVPARRARDRRRRRRPAPAPRRAARVASSSCATPTGAPTGAPRASSARLLAHLPARWRAELWVAARLAAGSRTNPFPVPDAARSALGPLARLGTWLRVAASAQRGPTRGGFDLIHTYMGDASVDRARSSAPRAGVPVLVSRRDLGFWHTPRAVQRAAPHGAPRRRRTSPTREAVKRHVVEVEHVPARRRRRGAQRPRPRRASTRPRDPEAARRAWGSPRTRASWGSLANLKPLKRQPDLVEAVAAPRAEAPRRSTSLFLGDGRRRRRRATAPRALGVADRVHVHHATGGAIDAREGPRGRRALLGDRGPLQRDPRVHGRAASPSSRPTSAATPSSWSRA